MLSSQGHLTPRDVAWHPLLRGWGASHTRRVLHSPWCNLPSSPLSLECFPVRLASKRHEFTVHFHPRGGLEDSRSTHLGSLKLYMPPLPSGLPKIHQAGLRKPNILTWKIAISVPLLPVRNKREGEDPEATDGSRIS